MKTVFISWNMILKLKCSIQIGTITFRKKTLTLHVAVTGPRKEQRPAPYAHICIKWCNTFNIRNPQKQNSICSHTHHYAPLWKRRAYYFATVGRYVGISVSLNLVQPITQYLHPIRCFPSLRNEKRRCCYNIITTISLVISREGIHWTYKCFWSELLLFWKIPEIHLNGHLLCLNESKQSQTSVSYCINILRRYQGHVAMQSNHWRHPHFRWRCVMTFIVFLRIIVM